jgi:protein TonB
MTQALLHSLNVGTLATWMSVTGFGAIAVAVPQWHHEPSSSTDVVETRLIENIFTLGDEGSPEALGELADPLQAESPDFVAEILPAPPELAPLAEMSPLPEIPDLPEVPDPPVRKTTPSVTPSATRSNSPSPASRASGSTSQRTSSTASGTRNGVGRTGGSAQGMSDSARLAQGRMPSPSYPSESRRKGQTGTVVVEFTVDSSGRVISAHAKSPSPWPLLNNEAVRTVRRWKFPPGGVMKLQRPIVFQLR